MAPVAASLLGGLCSPQLEGLEFLWPTRYQSASPPASSSYSLLLRSVQQRRSDFARSQVSPSRSSVYKRKAFPASASTSGELRTYGSRSRFGFWELRSRRGAGIGSDFVESHRFRVRAEIGKSSVRGVGRPEAWEGGLSFCQDESVNGRNGAESWTQSISVEPMANQPFQLTPLQYDTGIACAVLVSAYAWVRFFDFLTSKQIVGQKLSRKIIHITSGLLYMFCWPLFSHSKVAPFLAGLVPLANGLRLLIYGFGLRKDDGLVKTMSRSGESRELLRGPLFYVVVLYLSTVLFWRRSPIGMIALAMMCGGDGIADIMGRKWGSWKLPYNKDKSFAGSISMFLFGFLVSLGCVSYFAAFGFFKLDMYRDTLSLALISFAATVVESLPITTRLDDNFTVPLTAFVLGIILFPLGV